MAQEKKIKLSVDKLKPGLYVDLELSWSQHPFLFKHFIIKSANDIKVIQELGLKEVTVYPKRCKTNIPDDEVVQSNSEGNKDQMWEQKQKRIDEAAQYRSKRSHEPAVEAETDVA